MRIIVCGSDGYLGWPLCLHLSKLGYKVLGIDNYLKRKIAKETKRFDLLKVDKFESRLNDLNHNYRKNIKFYNLDICNLDDIVSVVKEFKPNSIVHLAEQPSAPYSMIGDKEANLTLNNNLNTTHNILRTIIKIDKNIHLVKLGTMGEYGTPNIEIPEGYIDIKHKGRNQKFLFPRAASSLYHTTKVLDTDLIWFYVRVFGLRVTDLMQGPVYGNLTPDLTDTKSDTTFYFDDIFGTVLNRFITQAVCGVPLTIFGKGEQKRGYINLIDSIKCMTLSIQNPAKPGELNIHNQFTEVFSVNQLANYVKQAGDKVGLNVEKKSYTNPRFEQEEHYYNVVHNNLKKMGWDPLPLDDITIKDMFSKIQLYKSKINKDIIQPSVKWKY